MATTHRTRARALTPLVLVVALAACSGGDSATTTAPTSESPASNVASSTPLSTAPTSAPATSTATTSTTTITTGATTTSIPNTATTTTAATATTTSIAATTTTSTVAPTTTVAPLTVAGLTLLSDGIGPLRFGDAEAGVVTQLSALLGAPDTSEAQAYPVAVDGQFATDEFVDERFVYPAGSTVCFLNGLCTFFGGAAAGALAFVGWSQVDAPGALATPQGITIGSRWADHLAAMTVDEGGCYSDGSGSTAGVYLYIRSEGTPFLEVTDDGSTTIIGRPDPADAVVTALESGDQPFFTFLDC